MMPEITLPPAVEPVRVSTLAPAPGVPKLAENVNVPVPDMSKMPPVVVAERVIARLLLSPVPVYRRMASVVMAMVPAVPRLLVVDPELPTFATLRIPVLMSVLPVYVLSLVSTTTPVAEPPANSNALVPMIWALIVKVVPAAVPTLPPSVAEFWVRVIVPVPFPLIIPPVVD